MNEESRNDRIWRAYKSRKRKGLFRYYYGTSPYLYLARRFKLPIRHIRDILEDRKTANRKAGLLCPSGP